MYFNTFEYLLFLPLTCLLYYLVSPSWRWVVLFLASCTFYMWFVPEYILCLFFLIIVDFFLARKIHAAHSQPKKKLFLVLSIVSNFGLLFYFKYYNFIIQNVNLLVEPCFGKELPFSNDILPIGLSFHTFQSVSYVIDVYRKNQMPAQHLGIYSNFVLFFPQMVAGPIERFANLGTQLMKKANFEISFLKKSVQLILVGLFYKMVIADNCGTYVNYIYSDINSFGGINIWLAVVLFSIQIYADFFGYSLIAQGSASLFGISLMDNFKFPFFSTNIIEFWKKWHVSLTSWFRNYLYLPLGGNQRGRLKHLRNILIVFTLSGLWHGASWNFVIWGVSHSLVYILTVLLKSRLKLPDFKGPSYIFTFLMVSLIFVFFRSPGFSDATTIFRNLFVFNQSFKNENLTWMLFVCLGFAFIVENFARKHENYFQFLNSVSHSYRVFVLFCMFFLILTFSGVEQLPFIYFQF